MHIRGLVIEGTSHFVGLWFLADAGLIFFWGGLISLFPLPLKKWNKEKRSSTLNALISTVESMDKKYATEISNVLPPYTIIKKIDRTK